MARIRIFKDYLKREPVVHVTSGEISLLEWLSKSEYGYIGKQGALVSLNGVTIASSDDMTKEQMQRATDVKLGLFDSVDIIVKPKSTTALVIGVIVASLAVSIALTPEPEIPNNLGKQSQSPNNQLNAASNEFRPRQAIADISGEVVSYPDFVQNSYYIYENNIKKFVEAFCIGVGYHTVDEVKDGETLFNDIEGSTFAVYQPDETLPELADVRASNNVDGQVIIAPNDPQRERGVFNLTLVSPDEIVFPSGFNIDFSVGDSLSFDLDYFAPGVAEIQSFNQTLTVQSISGQSVIFQEQTVPNSDGDSADGSYVNLTEDPAGIETVLQGDETTEIRFHVVMPRGIRPQDPDSGDLTINLTLSAIEIDENGNEIGSLIQSFESISGNTLNEQYRTFYLYVPQGRYKASIFRTTDLQPSPAQDLVKFERLESVRYYTPEFGDVTTIITNRRATTQPTSGRRSKTNALVTRELELFDPNTGTFDNGNFTATRSFAQYVMYLLVKLGNVAIDDIAYQELFDIEDSLSDAQLGYFDFTFDSADVSLKQRLDSACNAARVKMYNVANVYRFVREEAKQVRQAVFNRRNVAPESASISWEAFVDSDYDSYELEYVDPITNSEAYIRRRINTSTGAIEEGLGNRVKQKPLAGCRNELQATDRCNMEVRRIRDQRVSVSDRVMQDALRVGVGVKVGWADINDDDYFHGEILEQDSATSFITSEPFMPETGVTYYVYITDFEGNVSNSVVATPRSDGNEYGFEATGLTAYTADGYERQLGSMYIIASSADANDFVMLSRGKPDDEGFCRIEMRNYAESMFEKDGQLGV